MQGRLIGGALLLCAASACSFDSEPVMRRDLVAGASGSSVNGMAGTGEGERDGGSGEGAGSGGKGGNAGGSGGSSADSGRPDAGGMDSGPADAGKDSGADAQIPDAGDAGDSGKDASPPIRCVPNLTRACYTGPAGTKDVGVCHAGTHTCKADGSGFGPCMDEVMPSDDVCGNDLDEDCNGLADDGYPNADGCECLPGATEDCYSGPTGTLGVGSCKAGTMTCMQDGTGWNACSSEVLPSEPTCAVADRDCNDISDDQQDLDGDGFSLCDADCCDSPEDCSTPALVNPGALDLAGNGVDDDCSGKADDALGGCDDALGSRSDSALDYARALELCPRTTADAARSAQRWGVISAAFSLADGSGSPDAKQRGLRAAFGAITPQRGTRMIALSTGHAAVPGDADPPFAAFDPGSVLGTSCEMPADWIAANGGAVPGIPACPAPAKDAVYDSAMLTLEVRVPTNVHGFSLRAYFLSSEFPEYVCSEFIDYTVVLLTSSDSANPSDGNLATFTPSGGPRYPLSANLAYGDSGLFRQCVNGPMGCANNGTVSQTTVCTGTADLTGTGFDGPAQNPCGSSDLIGGGTGWATLYGNVTPGEVITLRIALWDTGDAALDSLALFDAFTWYTQPVTAGLAP